MHTEKVGGFSVEMPFKPYTAQVQSMEVILSCLENRACGLIESPTGTGKSLSILCAVSAWVKKQREEGAYRRVYICSRTHKQLNQLIEQLKKLPNPPTMSILASRTHLCLNRAVLKEPDRETACKNLLRGTGGCDFFTNKENIEGIAPGVFNIEDLKQYGHNHGGCPYFGSKKLLEDAEIIFAPYNYIINPMIRKALSINLDEAAVIIDEGHNIEDACRSAGSADIEKVTCDYVIAQLIAQMNGATPHSTDSEDNTIGACRQLKITLDAVTIYLEKQINELRLLRKKNFGKKDNVQEIAIKQDRVVDVLKEMGITPENIESLSNAAATVVREEIMPPRAGQFLDQMMFVSKQILTPRENRYGIVISDLKITFACLHPEVIFSQVSSKARCVVLLSGTLRPFPGLCRELTGNKNIFTKTVEAPHIINTNQIFPICVSTHENKPLLGTYVGMKEAGYLPGVCAAITAIAQSLKGVGGTLCFVPSYAVLEQVSRGVSGVEVFKEPSDPLMFDTVLEKYRRASRRGACAFVCVFRGRASEGIDFRDHEARAVIAIGIPFPSISSQAVALKKEYNDKYMGGTGGVWYEAQAYKAVNQAIGRCIRHRSDWGAIFLLDTRYSYTNNSKKLSGWATGHLRVVKEVRDVIGDFAAFIKKYNAIFPAAADENDATHPTTLTAKNGTLSLPDPKKRKISRYFM
ncbi:hypothetical protein NEDG_00766 [Nematocida displodere]|uniref:DNA 5'-3' helicase n=1 Tax=Nematocida displodere TaxID=1805483 RepID=A0A177ECF1_9MICR|nr:hypothetical protein NEDG_00766 [Nematocida displodere]